MVNTYYYNNVARSKQKPTEDGSIKLAAKRATTLYRCYGNTKDDIYRENCPYYVRHGHKDFEVTVKVKAKMQHLSDQSGLFIREKRDKYCAIYLEISHPTNDEGLDKSRNNYYISVCSQNGKDEREYTRLDDLNDCDTYHFKMKRIGDVVELYASKDGHDFGEPLENYFFSKEEKLNVGCFAASPGDSSGLKSTFSDLEYEELPSDFNYGADSSSSEDDNSSDEEKEKEKAPPPQQTKEIEAAPAPAKEYSDKESSDDKSSKYTDDEENLEKQIAALEADVGGGDSDKDDGSKSSKGSSDSDSSDRDDDKKEEAPAPAPVVEKEEEPTPAAVVAKEKDYDSDQDLEEEIRKLEAENAQAEDDISGGSVGSGGSGGSVGSGGGGGSDSDDDADLEAQIAALEAGLSDSDSD